MKRRSYVYLEVGNKTGQVLIKLTRLPDDSQLFKIHATTKEFSIKSYFLFSILHLTKPWLASHDLTGKKTTLPAWTIISWMEKRKLDKIMQGHYSVLKLIIHTHHYEYDNAALKSHNKQREKETPPYLDLGTVV